MADLQQVEGLIYDVINSRSAWEILSFNMISELRKIIIFASEIKETLHKFHHMLKKRRRRRKKRKNYRLWNRLKIQAKADIDALRKDAGQTGEGPPKPPLGRPEQIISEMFGGQFDPLAGAFEEGPGEEDLEDLRAEEMTQQETPSCETPSRSSK